ncbi:MAG: hypothetical protein C7B45_02865 [Sulfobacillus acidophilus]|uniref:Uncharacterized protein n=1 Tax=Sulfobacillus acidophilus TaxID=53633 RepID=A0A2T2WMP4_9FIRM|nr:MAG: hypothetical protein C7B45_02865 [Sulfobacillus acidophilus]
MPDLIWPVYLSLVNSLHTDWIPADPLLSVQPLRALSWCPPWPWYPKDLPHWGISPAPGPVARVWFAGNPQGQERRVFDVVVEAVGRKRRLLHPVTEATLAPLGKTHIAVAVLTTPG